MMRISLRFLISGLWVGILLAGCSHEPTNRADLEDDFKAEYGFPPSSKITELHSKIVTVGDTWSKWMVFTYDAATVAQITSAGFTNATAEQIKNPWGALWSQDLASSQPNPNAPKWFQLPGGRQVRIYYKLGHPNDYAGYRYIWIDETNKTVYAKSAAWH